MPRVSSLRKSASKPSNPTLPSANVCVYNSLKTERRSLHLFPCVLCLCICCLEVLTNEKNDGCLNFVDENDEVLISGFGRSGKAKGDIPGVRFKVVKVSGVGLLALWKEKKVGVYVVFCPDTLGSPPLKSAGKAKVMISCCTSHILHQYHMCHKTIPISMFYCSLCQLMKYYGVTVITITCITIVNPSQGQLPTVRIAFRDG